MEIQSLKFSNNKWFPQASCWNKKRSFGGYVRRFGNQAHDDLHDLESSNMLLRPLEPKVEVMLTVRDEWVKALLLVFVKKIYKHFIISNSINPWINLLSMNGGKTFWVSLLNYVSSCWRGLHLAMFLVYTTFFLLTQIVKRAKEREILLGIFA